ncbi:MAG: AAA family ATPase, partial [Candidatus Poseidoniia archaeon]|nr:AAA family ATPase [Candidatus Poseidoniia archaeon]
HGNIRIRDLDEARFLAMIVSGLVLQYLILAYNVLVRQDASISLGEEDTALTVMALGVAAVGVYSFYRKRQGEGNSVGLAYFGIFAAGIFALFALFIAPVALSGRELAWPKEQGSQVRVATALLVSLLGLWLSVRFISVKMKDFEARMDPGELDSFTPSPEAPSADTGSSWKSVDDAMEYILEQAGDEYQIELKHTTDESPDYEMVEKAMMSDVDRSATIRQAIEVDYDSISFEKISLSYSTSPDTVDEVVTQLKSGRNIMLYGEPGTGKTALSDLLLTEVCGEIMQPNGTKIPNFSIVTANAEWSNFDVIGGISPDDKGGYYFKDGCVAEAARACERSVQELGRPHYLVIDEFNRANIDEAFGKLFTVFEYRDKQPLLTNKETGGAPFFMPPEFRVIGTMNTQDKNTLFNVGMALMRRFAFIEIGLPAKDDEYNRMPIFSYGKLKKHGTFGERPADALEWGLGDKCPYFAQGKFDYYDESGEIFKAYEKLMDFVEEQEAPTSRGVEEPLGVRTFRKIGPALIIDSMVTIVNSIEKAGWEKAVNKVILSNILPSLEGLERNEIRCLALKATQVFGTQAPATLSLERMADSPGLSVFG